MERNKGQGEIKDKKGKREIEGQKGERQREKKGQKGHSVQFFTFN